MQQYKNKSGNSGVTGYAISEGQIIVQFKGDSQYVYNHIKPGSHHVNQMQRLAVLGQGLNRYISQNVNTNYFEKL
ncbi:hypothetical protein [Marinoscillum luteum]|uniref:KTSC domain-containing protein n=1 Tax=Marinoscillum luteum TaxID=861051 RepID=A0ABW7NCB4_9BACT